MTGTPMQITGFELIERLGTGGMATVWKARQLSLDRIVAIKILSSQLATDPDDVRRFQKEAQSAARLKHPGIVQVYDANMEHGLYYFVMEYVAGYTVGEWLRRKEALPEGEALLVAEHVSNALRFAWQQARIIHCDIKPDNVMVDTDGTVKVADLGLARTISAMSAESAPDEILGTPAYMSPEQVTGASALDCRTDIYSLGAMLYHLVTGKMLFAGLPDEEVMDRQVSGTTPDPMDVNAGVSSAAGWLIEKMLAKDPGRRHRDWAAVLADIARVRKRLAPRERLPKGTPSTIGRSERRKESDVPPAVHRPPVAAPAVRRPRTGRRLVVVLALAAAAAAAVLVLSGKVRRLRSLLGPRTGRVPASAPAGPAAPPTASVEDAAGEEAAQQRAAAAYERARAWFEQHPAGYDEAARRFRQVAAAAAGTAFAERAERDARRAVERKKEEIRGVLARLEQSAGALAGGGRYDEAVALYEGYAGPFATDTYEQRSAAVESLRARQAEAETARVEQEARAVAARDRLLDETAAALIAGDLPGAQDALRRGLARGGLAGCEKDVRAVAAVVADAAGADEWILGAFAGLAGQEISVGLTRGTQKIVIEEVRDGTVLGRRQISRQNSVASTPVSFRVADLTLMEKLLRVGSDDRPAVALYKGMLALGARANRHAKGYFARTHPLLAERLVQGVEKLEHRGAESAAAAALARLLKGTGIPADPSDSNVWERAVAGLRLNEKDAAGLAGQVEAYRREHGDTEHAGAAAPLLRALLGRCEAQLPLETALPEGLEDTEQGQKTVVEMMLRRNPDLRHSEICIQGARIRGVYRVDVISPHLADIRALAAFPNLRELYLSPVSESRWRSDTPPCPLRDLRALRGLPLEVLHLVATSVKDLSPLRGMPLETLNLHATPVADLTPLQGLPLRTLDLRSTEVKNLSPLSGAPLRWLDAGDTEVVEIGGLAGVPLATLRLNRTGVKDLSALRDMPVKELDISYTEVRDLSPLRDTPLTTLRIDGTQITDLSPLRDMRVTTLSLSRTRVDSLADLRGKRIERLSVADTNVKDLSPLAGMPLTELNITGCQIRDLTALRGLPLTSLRLARTAVYELAPLEGKKIEILDISGTRVTSLKPLAAFPLRMLLCQDMEVKDYAPLRSAPLERIWIDRTEEVDALLKTMPDLEQVNGEAWNP